MTPEQLKACILQYAIQGKLVEQRPEEGTAEELYQQIQEEKQKLIKEGKIKKEKPLPEVTNEEIPFEIPDSWKWCKLGQCGYFVRGNGIKKDETISKGMPCIRYGQLYTTYKTRFSKAQTFISKELFDRCQKAHKNDILMALTGENEYDIALAVTYEGEPEIAIGGDMTKFCHTMNPLYLTYVLNSRHGILCKSKMASGNIIVHISNDKLTTIPIPLPPLAEQHRIVAKIEELLPLIDRYAESYEKLELFNAKFPEDMKKAILQYAIQGKLVEQRPEEGTAEELYQQIQDEKERLIKKGELKKTRALPAITEEEIPFDFPETWKVCYIDDIAFVTKLAGFEYTKYIADNLVSEGIPLFKGKNVQNGELVLSFESYIPESVSDELPRSQITKKCLLTPYVGTIGNIAIFDGSFKAHLGSNVGKIEILNSQDKVFVTEEYLLLYLKSQYGYNELTKYKKATAQESISIDAIRNVIIAIPPLAEQKRIVKKVDELLPYCDRLVK